MKASRINYFAVGLFVIASIVGLVVAIAVLSGRTGATDPYYAIYRNVTGVKFGTQVMYEGYPIGQVETVTPVPEAGRMTFRV
ncbi:MAG: MCE family protein, partial [Alphaproteobacteria bacterium]|nr:MCE family protein [Alphaproteobacteria bacterium]